MTITDSVLHFVAGLMFERPTRGLDATALATRLAASAAPFDALIAGKPDTAANRTLLAHIIGIESWAQARVRQLITGARVVDEALSYTPSAELPYAELVTRAQQTRAASQVTLAALSAAGVGIDQQIAHNQFGLLSVAGWTQYIITHANLEAKKMR